MLARIQTPGGHRALGSDAPAAQSRRIRKLRRSPVLFGGYYTALGYGDIVLDTHWRLLCGFEAINGLMLFGVSTALLFIIFQRFWLIHDSYNQEHPSQ